MPQPAFYPTDKSILLLNMDWSREPLPLGGRRGCPMFFRDTLVEPHFQYRERSWTGSSSPGPWGDFTDLLAWRESKDAITQWPMASTTVAISGTPEAPVRTVTRGQMEWRLAWKPVPITVDGARNNVHVRWREIHWEWPNQGTNAAPTTYSIGATFNHWWHPRVLPDYDPDDPRSWPGTDWRITPVAPELACNFGETSWAVIGIQILWGRWALQVGVPNRVTMSAEGFIPGVDNDSRPYLNPVFASGVY